MVEIIVAIKALTTKGSATFLIHFPASSCQHQGLFWINEQLQVHVLNILQAGQLVTQPVHEDLTSFHLCSKKLRSMIFKFHSETKKNVMYGTTNEKNLVKTTVLLRLERGYIISISHSEKASEKSN